MTGTPVIQTRDLTKSYGGVAAVRGLNLSVEPNRITAFLGQNGAGKSTTIKMLLGMVRPSCGDGTVLGKRITDAKENCEMRRSVAYVAENKPLYGYMTVEQTIRFASSFYSDWRTNVAKKLLNEYKLPLQRKVKSLSKGMRTELALLLAFARRPELLILDEPSALPDGTKVRVQPVRGESRKPLKAKGRKSKQGILKHAGKAKNPPTDAARNLDHYLYGHPKQ